MATPYELLLGMSLLREKKRIQHREENTDSEGNSFLQVDIAGHDVLLRQNDIEEIIPATLITQVPDTQNWFKGLTSYRGNLLPLIDLAALLLEEENDSHKSSEVRILVIQTLDSFLGLYVQKVEGIQHHWLHKSKIQHNDDKEASGILDYCDQYRKQNNEKVFVLVIDKIKQHRNFIDA